KDSAVINRMGFNNDGHAAVLARLRARAGRGGIVGVNIGANKDTLDRAADYVAGIEAFSGVADYLAVNISSPNTPGLRDLQSRKALQELLARLNEARTRQDRRPPMLLKIAPDLESDELAEICEVCMDGAVDGLIVSNTTVSRPALKSTNRGEAGGLSGAPLREMSTRMLANACHLTGGALPLIGVGGISSAADAFEKICAGASLVQLYTAMVYKGPGLANDIAAGLAKLCRKHNLSSISKATGSAVDKWL
ncbi:MAG TPA: quinone-dependent dihydroorotate dehydrogenase, partial [Rhizobiales bacterium]|nr:quinone-dependent dihydroorotate dehydrogenase [Hyphomicrobiales bacterium]